METAPKKQEKDVQTAPLEIDEKTRAELGALFRGEEWNGEKIPPVFLKLFSGPHGTKEDAEGIKPLLDKADVYVPEYHGWSRRDIRVFLEISGGKYDPKGVIPFADAMKEALFNTHKPIMLVDVPNEEVKAHPEWYEDEDICMRSLRHASYEEAVNSFFDTVALSETNISKNREIYMVKHFAEKLKKTVSLFPELHKKDVLHILMTLGDAHSIIYHEMKKNGGDHVSRDFRYNPSLGYISEMGRSVVFGKEISEDLKERALCNALFNEGLEYLLEGISTNTSKNLFFVRHLVSLFSPDEMRILFVQWQNIKGNPSSFFLSLLKQKGIIFPKNEEEMDEILAKTPYGKYQKTLEEIKQKNGTEK